MNIKLACSWENEYPLLPSGDELLFQKTSNLNQSFTLLVQRNLGEKVNGSEFVHAIFFSCVKWGYC